ncbi:uncharacterized protein Eint_071440 [Encephalitozoon intestinalis ATCC 50506]|uniref:Uncharacterized protein n=1 Tax=Encephalitozoon intestinalis (strain ATCC 50506) TaxID=876142 RepID=E0S871_ENCIT|nr:uncharacterized protein Eint_071440 [Encephalitozoon intestinalis ATCC 50506]ADM11906.1 hypothetical protein Eint_071440 [Encephalitozoon intestinalis ATCC 50506]UTX45662.1 heterodimeric restriction endonuclease R.BSPD6I small subunit [Encephalitozoon intestinalis]
MLHDVVIVALALAFCFFLVNRKRRLLDKKTLLLEPFKKHFERSAEEFPSIHQSILKLVGHPSLDYLCGIITLKRDFCLSYILGSVPKESLILTGQLKVRTPCMYVFRKTLPPKHYGLKYTKKCLLGNIPGYRTFGALGEKHLEFIKKYDVSIFFVSYAPQDIEDSPSFESQVFLKAGLSLLENPEFIDDFLGLFDTIVPEPSKRVLEMKQGYNRDAEALKVRENRSFGEKMAFYLREKNKIRKK